MYPDLSPVERIAKPMCGMIEASPPGQETPSQARERSEGTTDYLGVDMSTVPAHHLSVGN